MKKILVVEDEAELQQIYLERLSQDGYKVLQAFDGKQGLALAKSEKPNLILLDIMLPGGMNGFDVLEQIKIDRDLFNIPVLMLTNLDTERQTALSIGAVDYIVKAESSIDSVMQKVKQYAS